MATSLEAIPPDERLIIIATGKYIGEGFDWMSRRLSHRRFSKRIEGGICRVWSAEIVYRSFRAN